LRKRLPVAAKIAFMTAGTMADGSRLAHPAGAFGVSDDVHLDGRCLAHPQGPVRVEVGCSTRPSFRVTCPKSAAEIPKITALCTCA